MNTSDPHDARASGPHVPPNRGALSTEQRHPRTEDLHTLSAHACVSRMIEENRAVQRALEGACDAIARFVEAIEPGFTRGGRLVYLGAGTSGRLGVLDASEAPPTFQLEPGRIIGIIAGGDAALRRSSEGLEDDPLGAVPELDALRLGPDDALLGIAAGGTTPYVLGALEYAARADARPGVCGLMVCTRIERPIAAQHFIVLDTGPEVLTGSTRLNAGSATKMALNAISTTLMVLTGRVYRNLMVDVRATNAKLRDRAARIVAELTGRSRDDCFAILDSAGGSAKTAVVMARLGVERVAAEDALRRAGGRLAQALGETG